MSSKLKPGDLVKTPKVSASNRALARGAGMGPGYYDWEGKLGIVVGFNEIDVVDAGPFVRVLVQGKKGLCVFSPSTLTKVEK